MRSSMPMEGEKPSDASQVSSDLSEMIPQFKSFLEAVQSSDVSSDEDKALAGSIASQLEELASSLSEEPSQPKPKASPMGPVSAEAGIKNVKPAY